MRSVRDIKVLEGIPVLVRASLNVPIKQGKVTNAFRLRSALPTIEYLRSRHAKVILMSHVSGTGAESLEPVYHAMSSFIHGMKFCPVSVGREAREAVRALSPGGVLMLENLRRNAGEEKNDPGFAKELASLADIYVQDSFDVCHRAHASVVGVPAFLPSYAGFTVEKEVKELAKALKPKSPSLAIIAGAKFSTKEPLIRKLLKKYKTVMVGGALANDFIQAQGYSVGASLVSKEGQDHIRELLKNKRIMIPKDAVVGKKGAKRLEGRITELSDIRPDEMILDVGPKTVKELQERAKKAKSILWNGPLGLFEDGYIDGTRGLMRGIAHSRAWSIVGGGDTEAAIEEVNAHEHFSFISTGGGAMLDFLAHGNLPGLQALD